MTSIKMIEQIKQKLKHQVIAHRGAPRLAPENTLASFAMAAKNQAKWIEFDTKPCCSGEWIVLHDATLERTTNGRGTVIDTPYSVLKTLDCGSWFDAKFQNERIPLLSEVLQLCQHLGLHPNIEIKLEAREQSSISVAAKETLLKNFSRILTSHWPSNLAPPLLSSFDFDTLLRLKTMVPQCPLGFIVETVEPELLEQLRHLEAFSLHCNYENLQKDMLAALLQQRITVLLYTINDRNLALSYFEQGVQAIFSDIPNLLE